MKNWSTKEQCIAQGIESARRITHRFGAGHQVPAAQRSDAGRKSVFISRSSASFRSEVAQQVLWDVRYEGYVTRQQQQVDRQQRMAAKRIPDNFDYNITGLRMEARQKLSRVRPISLDQASRISGITPADLALVLAHVENPAKLASGSRPEQT